MKAPKARASVQVQARAQLNVLYTPGQIAAFSGAAAGLHCVVVDQLRATSTIVTALAHGASVILAVGTVEEARQLKRRRPAALLAGERGGVPPPGFDLGNSPREFTPEAVSGREIILTTTNGTAALLACRGASVLQAASFLNLEAVAGALLRARAAGAGMALLCAGTEAFFSLEDAIVAGALAGRLEADHPAASIDRFTRQDLSGILRRTVNGRRLVGLGLGEDIAWSLQRDRFPIVPWGVARNFEVDGGSVEAVALTR